MYLNRGGLKMDEKTRGILRAIIEEPTGTPDDIMSKIPECCGQPVEVFEFVEGCGEWVAQCAHCRDGTTTLQTTREAAIKAWERECVYD
mgnify:CR=1 FL=1